MSNDAGKERDMERERSISLASMVEYKLCRRYSSRFMRTSPRSLGQKVQTPRYRKDLVEAAMSGIALSEVMFQNLAIDLGLCQESSVLFHGLEVHVVRDGQCAEFWAEATILDVGEKGEPETKITRGSIEELSRIMDPMSESQTSVTFEVPKYLSDVMDELRRAKKKFPAWSVDPMHAVVTLGEEFGELMQAVHQCTYEPEKSSVNHMYEEAVQTAAMALRFLENFDHYVFRESDQV